MATASGVRGIGERVERKDPWWIEPLTYVVVLGGFVIYAAWAALQNANYYAEPYLSPFYSPCLARNCVHQMIPIIGSWWNLSPAILIVGSPLAFRVTCYWWRRTYYRGFFFSPPACAIPEARKRYSGETRFPFILQNIHRYSMYLAAIVLLFLWWDVIQAFDFGGHFGVGLGTVILAVDGVLLTGYVFGCHSARYLVGGHLDSFHRASLRFRLWSLATKFNVRHGWWAWSSLIVVAFTDLYIRMVAMGVIVDPRWIS